MRGLIDHYLPSSSREIGECIYCGERDAPLTKEHAVPYGLNGPWTLLNASCAACAKITTRFEHDVMRALWPDVRSALAMQSRRRDKRSLTLPIEVQWHGLRQKVQVPRASFPTYLAAPLFPIPTALWTDTVVEGVFANLRMLHICGPTFADASKEYPGANFVGMHINFSPEAFARMIAKIGFCAAIAALGLGAFTNTPIRNIILGSDPCICRWVGSWWGETVNEVSDNSQGLHQIRITLAQPGAVLHAIIRLFAQFGAPEYHVVLGPADPTFVASAAWPKQWRNSTNHKDYLHV